MFCITSCIIPTPGLYGTFQEHTVFSDNFVVRLARQPVCVAHRSIRGPCPAFKFSKPCSKEWLIVETNHSIVHKPLILILLPLLQKFWKNGLLLNTMDEIITISFIIHVPIQYSGSWLFLFSSYLSINSLTTFCFFDVQISTSSASLSLQY